MARFARLAGIVLNHLFLHRCTFSKKKKLFFYHCIPPGDHVEPILDLVNPQHEGPWGARSPIPENNAIAISKQDGSLFAAAGDACAYCWDVVCIFLRKVESVK